MISFLGTALTLIVLYLSIRNSVNIWRISFSIREVIQFVLLAPFLSITFTALLVFIPVAKLIKSAVDLTLKLRLADEYGGIVKGLDVSFCAYQKKKEKSFIKALLIVEYNKKLGGSVDGILEKHLCRMPDRFFVTIDEFMGYPYFKKIKIRLGDVVKKMPLSEEVLNRAQLLRAMERCCSESLPLNGAGLWDVHVGSKPLKWRTNSDANIEYYPVFARFHHVLGDGVNLLKMMVTALGSDEDLTVIRFPDKRTLITKIVLSLNTLSVFPSAMYSTLLLKTRDTNEIHQMVPPDADTLRFSTDENGVFFQKAKNIRKASGATISEIVVTAFTASLNDYFQKHCSTMPEYISVAILIALNEVKTENKANNNFTSVILKAPLDVSNHKHFNQRAPLISRLNVIRALSNNLKKSGECQFNKILMEHFIGSLPVSVFLKVIGRMSMTSVVSLLPGPRRFSCCDGLLTISDCMFWPPYVIPIGISLSSLTFDDRLQMVMYCKCGLTKSSDARKLLDGVYKYIGLIEQEINLKMKEWDLSSPESNWTTKEETAKCLYVPVNKIKDSTATAVSNGQI